MPINITGVGNTVALPSITRQSPTNNASVEPFQKLLNDATQTLGRLQSDADTSVAKLAAGEPVELHEVLLATEQANLTFQLVMQVRNKVVDAYQEIMRMQV